MAKYDTFEVFDAVDVAVKLRLGLTGISGGGKTYTALAIAKRLAEGNMSKVMVLDTENNSSAKYRKTFGNFKVMPLFDDYSPQRYAKAIEFVQRKHPEIEVLIIDSLTHAWAGKQGALEQVDKAAIKFKGNRYAAFSEVTPHHVRLIDNILQSRIHIIATMREKTDTILEEIGGKQVPKKVGMKAIQREGMEYEFDVMLQLSEDGKNCIVTKTRVSELSGQVFYEPGDDIAEILMDWMSGADPDQQPLSREQFLHVCQTKFGASGLDIKKALEEAGENFEPSKAPEFQLIVEAYMKKKAGDKEEEEEEEK